MSKITTYLGILGTILIGAHLMGLIANTGTSILFSWLANPEQLFSSSFFSSISNILTLFATAGVIIGLFTSQKTDLVAIIGFTSLLFLVGWDMLAIYSGLKTINTDLALLIMSPALLIYLITVIEWWRGIS